MNQCRIQPILDSCDLTGDIHFWLCPAKKILICIYFLWICINMQKLSSLHLLIIQIQSISKSLHMTGHTHFWPYQPLKLSYYFSWNCTSMQKIRLIPLFNSILESSDQIGHINLLKMGVSSICSGEIWLIARILAYISGARFFPNNLCRNTANKNFQYRINTVKINDQIFL